MMLSQKLEKLVENWPAKIISLVVAILVYAFYQNSILDSKNIAVPVQIRENGSMKVVSKVDKSVHVSVKGLREDLVALEARDFNIFVDLSSLSEEGEFTLPLNIVLSENATVMENLEVQVSPMELTLQVQEYVSASIPLVPQTAGTTAYGYQAGNVTAEPPAVDVYGPRSIVEKIQSFPLETVSINDRKETFEEAVAIINDNSEITIKGSSEILVRVEVGMTDTQKVYSKVPVKVISPSEPYFIENPEQYVKVTLEGKVVDLEGYSIPRNTFYIDCSSLNREGKYTLPVKNYKLSKGTLYNVYPNEITVTIGKVVEEPPEYAETELLRLEQEGSINKTDEE